MLLLSLKRKSLRSRTGSPTQTLVRDFKRHLRSCALVRLTAASVITPWNWACHGDATWPHSSGARLGHHPDSNRRQGSRWRPAMATLVNKCCHSHCPAAGTLRAVPTAIGFDVSSRRHPRCGVAWLQVVTSWCVGLQAHSFCRSLSLTCLDGVPCPNGSLHSARQRAARGQQTLATSIAQHIWNFRFTTAPKWFQCLSSLHSSWYLTDHTLCQTVYHSNTHSSIMQLQDLIRSDQKVWSDHSHDWQRSGWLGKTIQAYSSLEAQASTYAACDSCHFSSVIEVNKKSHALSITRYCLFSGSELVSSD